MRTKLMIATAAAAALLAGAAYAQSDTAVNPTTLPDGVATGNAASNMGAKGQPAGGDLTAPLSSSDATVAPAAEAAPEPAPKAAAAKAPARKKK